MMGGTDYEMGDFSLHLAKCPVHPQVFKLCFKVKIGNHLNKV